MSTDSPAPKSPCTQYTARLSQLRSGSLSASEHVALRTHLQGCATCREQAEALSWQVIEQAMQRHYAAPTEAAPFLSLDDIRARVASSAQSEWTQPTERNANGHIVRLVETGALMRTQQERQITATQDYQPSRRAPSRWRTGAAVMAAVALVILFAVVVHTFTGSGHHSATSPTHSGTWTNRYTVQTKDNAPVVAPGDPGVVYRLTGSLGFQRSGDGGTSWTSYVAPNQKVTSDPQASLTLQVSPLNAMVVFATIWSRPSNPNCPKPDYTAEVAGGSSNELAQTVSLAGGYTCTFQYVSTDGGATWSTPDVPIKGDLGQFFFSGGSQLTSPFVAQGDRLYTALSPDINGSQPEGFRLVSSTDGLHWSLADAPLAAQSVSVYEYAATPTGSMLFVTTVPNTPAGMLQRELWRSDDAGAQWTDLGAFPTASNPQDTTYLLGAGTISSQTVIYYGTVSYATFPPPTPSLTTPLYSKPGGITPQNVYASLDNGKTWQAAPTAGIPAGQRAAPLSLGTLSNDSLVMEFDTQLSSGATSTSRSGSIAFYGWQPADRTWTPLSPSLAVPSNSTDLWTKSLWLAGGQGTTSVTILALIREDDGFTLWSCTVN